VDFGGRELILRRKIPQVVGPLRTQLEGERAAAIPIRMVGDHSIVADGTVNGAGPMPFVVDTGLAGYGSGYAFAAPASTLRAGKMMPELGEHSLAAADPSAAASEEKSKGGEDDKGKSGATKTDSAKADSAKADSAKTAAAGVTMIPFPVATLTLGPLTRHDLTGVAGPLPAMLEKSTGVKVGGLIAQAFFRPYAVTFDFEAATLWVVASGVGAQ
jgi:hypothetical protein